jgi:acetolactate synthase I/II/III large subunit
VLMYPQEIGTAVQYGADVIFIIVNNGMYGTIRTHQEHRYPDRVIGTMIQSPDFVAMAQSLGAHAERVESTDGFAAAFARAAAAGRPAVIELRTDPAQLSPSLRLP